MSYKEFCESMKNPRNVEELEKHAEEEKKCFTFLDYSGSVDKEVIEDFFSSIRTEEVVKNNTVKTPLKRSYVLDLKRETLKVVLGKREVSRYMNELEGYFQVFDH